MIAVILAVLTVGTFLAELVMGMVVTGLSEDDMVIKRAEKPWQYWTIMMLHAFVAFGLPALAFFAGI